MWAFALRTSITRVIESILFITIYRCFDVGDMIKLNDEVLKVTSIQLLNTTFKAGSGEADLLYHTRDRDHITLSCMNRV